jgi:ribonucleotide reductase beta subunit family protein with ferritin-like domain
MNYLEKNNYYNNQNETLTNNNTDRYVLFPIKYQEIWNSYKRIVSTFWTVEEVNLGNDRTDWEKLNDKERYFIKNILAFFAGSDGIIMENLAERFMNEIQIPEVRSFYSYQIFNENIHSEMYSTLIDTYIKDESEKTFLFKAIEKIPCVSKKANWAIKWIKDNESNFATRLIAFAAIEGIFFSGSFCAIYWIGERGLMPGLVFSNELISKDEGMHTDFAILLYSMIQNKLSQQTVHNIIYEAVNIEKEFICESLPCNLIGMNSTLMAQYIEFVADRLLKQLGYDIIYNTPNPFSFMEKISLRPKSNFFELRVGEYQKASVGKKEEDNKIELSDDF